MHDNQAIALVLVGGPTQIELARRADVGRHAAQYWEAKAEVNMR